MLPRGLDSTAVVNVREHRGFPFSAARCGGVGDTVCLSSNVLAVFMVHGAETIVDSLGDVYHVSRLAWRDGCALRDSDAVPREIFSPCAGVALYRTDALVNVGGFDEDYFCYVEDVGLGFHARSKYEPRRKKQ